MRRRSSALCPPVRPTQQRQRQRGEVRRQQIAEAALRIIASRGLNRLTAAELAREVGIADGTIFRHFRDKSEIVLLAIDHLRQRLADELAPPAALPPLERLERLVENRLRLAETHAHLYSLAFSDRLREAAGEKGLASLTELAHSTCSTIEDCLRAAQAEGTIDPQLPTRALAVLLLGAVHTAAALRALKHGRPEDSPQIVWQVLKSLLCRSGSGRSGVFSPEEQRANR